MGSQHLDDQLIRKALEEDRFILHFQPQADKAGAVVGVEALVRYVSEEGGLLAARHFIGGAERSKVILPLGLHVLKLASNQLVRWATQPKLAPLTMSLNISAVELCEPGYAASATAIIKQSGIDKSKLIVELTETMPITDQKIAVENALALRGNGIEVWVDNFPSGFASLKYLKWLPFDGMNVAPDLFQWVPEDTNSATIIKVQRSMATALKLKAGAKGLSRAQSFEWAKAEGFFRLLGAHIGLAVPAEEIEARMEQSAGDL